MSVASMTGFARTAGAHGAYSWVWEVRSVNNRGLDIRCRLPAGLDALEGEARRAIAARFARGAITATLQIKRAPGQPSIRLNQALLAELLPIIDDLRRQTELAAPRADGLLAIAGVLEPIEDEPDEAQQARARAILAGLEAALTALASSRDEEGRRIVPVIENLLAEIAELTAAAENHAAAQPEMLKARLKEQVAALLEAGPALPEERLAQEAALLAAKADVREEIDRLRVHVAAASDLLTAGAAIGRRFDFLCQELMREANTLCAKSADIELTDLGLSLKATVEQMREQVQNIE